MAEESKAAEYFDPLDPLSFNELRYVVNLVRKSYPEKQISFDVVTLSEPHKEEYVHWRYSSAHEGIPDRRAYVIVLEKEVPGVFEGIVNLTTGKIEKWEHSVDTCPIITADLLAITDEIVRNDANVIEQCKICGVPESGLSNVYCDPWTIGYDERYGSGRRLQQALMYYKPGESGYLRSIPLDFCPIIDVDQKKVIAIDIPKVRRPIPQDVNSDNNLKKLEQEMEAMKMLKPLRITQPEGVNFRIKGRYIEWQNFCFHIGFNYREGIVLSDVVFNEDGHLRPLFYRISLTEMAVPFGAKGHSHHRKHAYDLGEYGVGYRTNPLSFTCGCEGVIHYMDADFVNYRGEITTIKNAISIHEEDDGVLFKYSDLRDRNANISARSIKLVVSQVFTAANYEYLVYWIFRMDGVIECEIRLTGILNTNAINEDEDLKGHGTQVYPKISAENHEHLFCLRINPMLDGLRNSVATVDALRDKNGTLVSKYTIPETVTEAISNYDSSTGRTWDICNLNKLHPYSGKPVSYKLISRDTSPVLSQPGTTNSDCSGFAENNIYVTPYMDDQIFPTGDYAPQASDDTPKGLSKWISDDPNAQIKNTDIVVWHTFGMIHFPAPEDFPIMPAESIHLFLQPRNFFKHNPALDTSSSVNSTSEATSPNTHHENLRDTSQKRESHSTPHDYEPHVSDKNDKSVEDKLHFVQKDESRPKEPVVDAAQKHEGRSETLAQPGQQNANQSEEKQGGQNGSNGGHHHHHHHHYITGHVYGGYHKHSGSGGHLVDMMKNISDVTHDFAMGNFRYHKYD